MRARLVILLSASALLLLLISWPLSFYYPHGYTLVRQHKYGLWFDRGLIQFRYGTRTEPLFDTQNNFASMRVVPYNPPSNSPGRAPLPRIRLSPWRLFQSAYAFSGGQVPYIYPDHHIGYFDFGDRLTILATPHWFPSLLLVILILLACLPIHHHRTLLSRRLAQGLCPTCAYDLRASSERCPECGTPIPSPQSKIHPPP